MQEWGRVTNGLVNQKYGKGSRHGQAARSRTRLWVRRTSSVISRRWNPAVVACRGADSCQDNSRQDNGRQSETSAVLGVFCNFMVFAVEGELPRRPHV